jgi:DNA-directed RNA polymerase subunit M/transcription elongation factor TFIIS
MAKFCDICSNLVIPSFANDTITFKCGSCLISYPSEPVDTLRRERIKEADVNIFNKILDKAVDDPVSIKARIKCKNTNCSGDIVKQVRVGQDMRLYNICCKCRMQWLN